MFSTALFAMAAIVGQERPQEYPDLLALCPTNYGKVLYCRKTGKFALVGHSTWECLGHVRRDGKVQVTWTNKPGGDTAYGVYELKGGKLVGHWGWWYNVYFDADGNLHGSVSEETLRRTAPAPKPMPVPAADL